MVSRENCRTRRRELVLGETRVHVACQRGRLLDHQGEGRYCFWALRSCAILRSNCSRAIWQPIKRAMERIAASVRASSFRPISCPGEGEIALLQILSRLTAIVSIIPCPERAGDMEAWNAKLRKVLRRSVR